MKKNVFLTILVLGLLASNLLLVFLLQRDKRPPHPREPKEVIIERLEFDEQQVKDYEVLIREHRSGILKAQSNMKNLRSALYLSLQNETDNTRSDSLIHEIGKLQERMERIHTDHFRKIGELCRPEQQKAFQALLHDLNELFSAKPRPPKHRRP